MDTREDIKEAIEFYSIVGDVARNNGITIHLMTLEGNKDCNIAALSKLCEFTGG
jgi:hypothetical protein